MRLKSNIFFCFVTRSVRQEGVMLSAIVKSLSSCSYASSRVLKYPQYCQRLYHNTAIMASQKIQMADRLRGQDQSVWVEFGRLTVEHKAINLGQGFPDFFPPQYIRDALVEAAGRDDKMMNQYTRSYGHPRLVKALSNLYSPLLGRTVNPLDEILVTVGAYGSLFCAVQGLINPGDEVIIIEPYFDCYEPMTVVAGGVPVFVPFRPPKTDSVVTSGEWKLDPEELASKFNSKTKAIFVNTPNNPLGKILTLEELTMIADLCKKHDVIVFADEVYEWLVYKPYQHIKIASLPGMWDRTITIGSAGKTFSVTGWKTGWAVGPEHLIHALQAVHQNCNYTCPTPLQEAIAIGVEKELTRLSSPECYFTELPRELEPKRDRVARFLQDVGMIPTIPEGGYFMLADVSNLNVDLGDNQDDEPKDFKFVKWMMANKKLGAIPPSAFYSKEHKHLAENLIRLCFIKEDATLDKAEAIFKQWKTSS